MATTDDESHLTRGNINLKTLSETFQLPYYELKQVETIFPVKITPYYFSLIREKDDPIYRQVVPDIRELDGQGLFLDPLAEDRDAPVKSIVHRYPDRCLFLISHECAAYCRFCTRKRKVGDPKKIGMHLIEEGLRYIEQHREIHDVILSGGDPLMLRDATLESILRRLRKISHVEILRIGSRVPCFLPQRVTPALCAMFKEYHPVYMNVHFNHPDELTGESERALALLADAGIPLGCQTVLLKGVNDDPFVMRSLMQKLVRARVRPYYIYQADLVVGTEHFRTDVRKGLEIVKAIRGWTSGLAVPHFVIDAPGGGGKIPLIPEYVMRITNNEVVMRNFRGRVYRYRQAVEHSVHSEIESREMDLF
ncbi:MAG TPA: KamA family radical SAM protein [bacterium]|nr:KamA family radical SAM protein [bacterium]